MTPEVLNLVCQDTSHQGDDDIAEADDDVGLGDLSPREAETEHVEVEEGIDDGETGGLEGQPELDIEQDHHDFIETFQSPLQSSPHNLGLLTVSASQLCQPGLRGKLTRSWSICCSAGCVVCISFSKCNNYNTLTGPDSLTCVSLGLFKGNKYN